MTNFTKQMKTGPGSDKQTTIVYASLLAFKYTNPTDSYMFETPASKQHKIKTPISRWPKYYLAMPRSPYMAAPASKWHKTFDYEVIVNIYEVPESLDFKHSSQEPPPIQAIHSS